MERSNEHSDLATALAEARPAPREDFTQELDERVAAGFPRRSRLSRTPLALLGDRVRAISLQRLLFAGGGAVLATIAIATVIVAGSGSGQPASEQSPSSGLLSGFEGASESAEPQPRSVEPQSAGSAASGGAEYSAAEGLGARAGTARIGRDRHRDVERSAEISLLADPADVADDSAAVFAAVHDAHGIVLHSTTTSGKRGGARCDLPIPSARLGDALAAFSAIDEVRARHEATDDITAPTVATSERLRDSRARIDALLAQLSTAETETEMAAIETELAHERNHAARLRAQLSKLEQRTDFSRVSVRIETGATSADPGGAWGIGDAFGDAGHILGIAAGVTLIGLAVLAPIALLCLLAWLAHRAWVRSQRKRALQDA
jgi:hypothetical protein